MSLLPITLGETNMYTPKIYNEYNWFYSGIEWRWDINIPKSIYDYYKDIPRCLITNYSEYITHPDDDRSIEKITTEINRISEVYGFSEKEKIEFTTAFVQAFDYATDLSTTGYEDYTRFPIETLVEQQGDCEDTSIMLASLLDSLDVETALVYFPETRFDMPHMGIAISGIDSLYGTHWEYNDRDYYYIETTVEGLKIGAIPGEWSQIPLEILPLVQTAYISYEHAITEEEQITVNIELRNKGSIPAKGVVVYIFYYPDDYVPEGIVDQSDTFMKEISLADIPAGDSITVTFRFLQEEGYTPIIIRITSSNAIVE